VALPAQIGLLAAPFLISGLWYVLFAVLGRYVYPRLARDDADALRGGDQYVGKSGQPVGRMGWVRWIELAYVVYHFPVVVPGCWMSRDDTCSPWLIAATPPLYALMILAVLLAAG